MASISESASPISSSRATTRTSRRFAAIGPVWDGNEVWLIASGGLLFFAFPHVYASATSGFYLPLMIVLWLLILRGLSIEFRSASKSAVARVLGRCVRRRIASSRVRARRHVRQRRARRPARRRRLFLAPLFTHLFPSTDAGALDLYTVSIGLFAALALALHGCLYLRWKTSGPIAERATSIARNIFRRSRRRRPRGDRVCAYECRGDTRVSRAAARVDLRGHRPRRRRAPRQIASRKFRARRSPRLRRILRIFGGNVDRRSLRALPRSLAIDFVGRVLARCDSVLFRRARAGVRPRVVPARNRARGRVFDLRATRNARQSAARRSLSATDHPWPA